MKSVITQGATVAKAVEEALKKAGMPQEFFIKILQESQAGFLGFGSKKAKIALFFKKEESNKQVTEVLSQSVYKDLFDNKNIQRQIAQQDKSSSEVRPVSEKPKSGQRQHYQRRRLTNTKKQHVKSQQDQKTEKPEQRDDKTKSNKSSVRRTLPRRPRQNSRWSSKRSDSKKSE